MLLPKPGCGGSSLGEAVPGKVTAGSLGNGASARGEARWGLEMQLIQELSAAPLP